MSYGFRVAVFFLFFLYILGSQINFINHFLKIKHICEPMGFLKLSPWLPLNQLQRPNKAKLASFPFGVSRTQDTFGCFSDASSRITTALRTLHYPTVSNKVKDALTYSYAGIQSGQESANSSEQPINHLATDNQRLFFGHQWVLGLDSPWSFRRPMLLRWCSVDRRCDWCHLRVGRGTGWTLVSAPLPLWPGWAAPLPSMRRRTSSMGNGRDRCVWVDCEGTGGWLGDGLLLEPTGRPGRPGRGGLLWTPTRQPMRRACDWRRPGGWLTAWGWLELLERHWRWAHFYAGAWLRCIKKWLERLSDPSGDGTWKQAIGVCDAQGCLIWMQRWIYSSGDWRPFLFSIDRLIAFFINQKRLWIDIEYDCCLYEFVWVCYQDELKDQMLTDGFGLGKQ